MREILFKAKREDNSKWVEGNYVKKYDLSGKRHLILYVDNYVRWKCVGIDPKTLCQFTGLYDKNDKRIWENDIVNTDSNVRAQVKFGLYYNSFFDMETQSRVLHGLHEQRVLSSRFRILGKKNSRYWKYFRQSRGSEGGISMEKTCKSCRENDNGLCDRTGRLVEDDDQCEKWKGKEIPEWKARMMNTFLAGH